LPWWFGSKGDDETGYRFPPEIIQQAKSFAKGAKASDPWRSLGASAPSGISPPEQAER
jgi:hypothetical protein